MSTTKRAYKPVLVRVMTVNMADTSKPTDERVIDMTKLRDKTWLVKHMDWALRHKHGVQISPEN